MASNDGHRSSDFLSVASSSRPNFLGTFEPESHYPIFSTFCACLSIAEIVSLTRTCKLLSSLYQYLVPVQWDVDKALRHYVNDPHGFRSQLAKYDALVFGHCANDYFERTVGKCQYLDVAVQQGGGSELFSNYLSHGAGYAVTKSSTENLHHFLMAEVRVYEMIVVWITLANPRAIADPDLQQKPQQHDRNPLTHHKLPAYPSHPSRNLYYCRSLHPKLEQGLLYICAANIHPEQELLVATIPLIS